MGTENHLMQHRLCVCVWGGGGEGLSCRDLVRFLVNNHLNVLSARMSWIERKYCLIIISTSYFTGLFEIFILLHIWLNCVCLGDILPIRALCDAYHKEFESHKCSILDISALVSRYLSCRERADRQAFQILPLPGSHCPGGRLCQVCAKLW